MFAFIGKHWRGEYSLVVSYWVFGIAIGLVTALIVKIFTEVSFDLDYNPLLIIIIAAIMWLFLLAISVWHWVGVWRSARRRAPKPAGVSFWGWAARVGTSIGMVRLALAFGTTGVPQLAAMADITFNGDSKIPNYSVKITENGTELRISGGFKFGLARDVERLLAANPRIKTIDFDSIGGRIGEAKKVYNILRDRELNAVSNTHCASACVFAFAGGVHRWLGLSGRLGFHSASFVGLNDEMANRLQKLIVKEIEARDQVPAAFFDRVTTFAPTDMWFPTRAELLDNHFITEKLSMASSSKRALADMVLNSAQNIAKTLPKQLDPVTTWSAVGANDNHLIFVYDIKGIDDRVFQSDAVREKLYAIVRDQACATTQAKRDFELGVGFEYSYRSVATGRELYRMELHECGDR